MATSPEHPARPSRSARRHARPRSRRLLLLAGLAATAGGAALGAAPAAAAQDATAAAPGGSTASTVPESALGGVLMAVAAPTEALPTLGGISLNPLAGTPVNPLNNAVETQIADFQPISTDLLVGPLAEGASLGELPGALLDNLNPAADGTGSADGTGAADGANSSGAAGAAAE